MRTIDTIEQNSYRLFDRFKSYLQARREAAPTTRVDTAVWADSDWPVERPDSGGYNEAFVMHHWASLRPMHRSLE